MKAQKELQDEVRLYRNLANSTSRGMAKIKNEELQDMKIRFKNFQDIVGKLQKENKELRNQLKEKDKMCVDLHNLWGDELEKNIELREEIERLREDK